MAAKRFFDDADNDPDQLNHKRMKTRPSLASVVKEVVMVNFLENFCATLEPLLRRVVNEEVENGLKRNMRSLTKSPSLRIQALHEQPSLKLIFRERLSLPIFTGSKITDIQNEHLQLILVETNGTDGVIPAILPHSLKIEMVVLDGDFPSEENDDHTWTNQDFDKNIVKERTGRRPLLAGDLNIILRDGVASVGDLEFTDNSSWIRGRKFRIGARVVVQGASSKNIAVMIKPAMTESFVVKDHRGELYKKHYPPALHDEVWRLEKIGKDGAFHRKLSAEDINTVQDFLQLSVIDPSKLRKILGVGMSEKMWDATHKHAWTCKMGSKHYIARGSNYVIILNAVCQVIKAVINGQTYSTRDLTLMHRAYIEKLLKDAHENWNTLEEVDAQVHDTPLLLTTGDEMVDQIPQPVIRTHQRSQALASTDGSSTDHRPMASTSNNNNNNDQLLQYTDWVPYLCTPAENVGHYNFSESSSDGDLR